MSGEDPRLAFLRTRVRDVPDFPKPGILFRDLTPLMGDGSAMQACVMLLGERVAAHAPDVVVAVESRGFIFGAPVAAALGLGFAPVRKPGKLPASVDRVEFQTEYSREALEMHKGSIREEARVVVVDDVLATGGTAKAAADLVHLQGGYVIGYAFVVELGFLLGREKLLPARVESCIAY